MCCTSERGASLLARLSPRPCSWCPNGDPLAHVETEGGAEALGASCAWCELRGWHEHQMVMWPAMQAASGTTQAARCG